MKLQPIVINVQGGIVQDVYGAAADVPVILVDWDTEGTDDHPDLVEIPDGGDWTREVFVGGLIGQPFTHLVDTEIEAAMRASQEHAFDPNIATILKTIDQEKATSCPADS